jgi:8-oxo-dGTP pyrophosphatase MutT (NUDIX family)
MNADLRDVLQAYHARFPDEIDRHEVFVAQLVADEDVSVRTNLCGHVTTSATVLNVQQDKVLLIYHRTFHKWLPPGGHYEAPGSLWDSAVRETIEETGLRGIAPHPWTVDNAVPIDIDTHPIPANPTKGEGPHLHHDFRFLAIASEAEALVPDLAEVSEARWAPIAALRESPDDRVRALYNKLCRLGIFDGRFGA